MSLMYLRLSNVKFMHDLTNIVNNKANCLLRIYGNLLWFIIIIKHFYFYSSSYVQRVSALTNRFNCAVPVNVAGRR